MSKSEYIGYIIITCIMAITVGIIAHVFSDAIMKRETIKEAEGLNSLNSIKISENKIKETSSSKEKTTPNTLFIFETHFLKCCHNEIQKSKIEKEDINKTEEELKEKYIGWNIKKFSTDEVYLYREEDRICKNHSVVKENNGKISVYSLDQNGNETLKTETNILTKYLPEEDVDFLKKGIKASNETEIQNILSDFE